jgi:hypothetical protein
MIPESVSGRVGDIPWVVRPEWLAGRHWWRVVVGGHPKVLVFALEFATQAAEVLATDEAEYRRQVGHASSGG